MNKQDFLDEIYLVMNNKVIKLCSDIDKKLNEIPKDTSIENYPKIKKEITKLEKEIIKIHRSFYENINSSYFREKVLDSLYKDFYNFMHSRKLYTDLCGANLTTGEFGAPFITPIKGILSKKCIEDILDKLFKQEPPSFESEEFCDEIDSFHNTDSLKNWYQDVLEFYGIKINDLTSKIVPVQI